MTQRDEFLQKLLILSQDPVFKELLNEMAMERQERVNRILTLNPTAPAYDRRVAQDQGAVQGLDYIQFLITEAKSLEEKRASSDRDKKV